MENIGDHHILTKLYTLLFFAYNGERGPAEISAMLDGACDMEDEFQFHCIFVFVFCISFHRAIMMVLVIWEMSFSSIVFSQMRSCYDFTTIGQGSNVSISNLQ